MRGNQDGILCRADGGTFFSTRGPGNRWLGVQHDWIALAGKESRRSPGLSRVRTAFGRHRSCGSLGQVRRPQAERSQLQDRLPQRGQRDQEWDRVAPQCRQAGFAFTTIRQSFQAGFGAGFLLTRVGYVSAMELSLLLIIIGIVLAILVHYALGIVLILIGLVLLIWPRLRAGTGTRRV